MAKSGLERAADLAQLARAIANIIKAALKGGWAGAAVEALKQFWPKLIPIAVAIILLPAIIVVCLPAMLLGFGGSPEQDKADAYRAFYDKYHDYRAEQLDAIRDQQNATCSIEYENGDFDKNWLIAIDSVNNENDINNMTEDKLKALIQQTYTYEIVYAQPETSVSSSNPWGNTVSQDNSSSAEPANPTKIIKVTTRTPEEVMRILGFDQDHIDWATAMHDALAGDVSSGLPTSNP